MISIEYYRRCWRHWRGRNCRFQPNNPTKIIINILFEISVSTLLLQIHVDIWLISVLVITSWTWMVQNLLKLCIQIGMWGHSGLRGHSDWGDHSDFGGLFRFRGSFVQICSWQCQLTLSHHILVHTVASSVVEIKCLSTSGIRTTILSEAKF